MKKILVLLGALGIGIYFLVKDSEKAEIEKAGKKIKKKLQKSHFPKKQVVME